MGQASENRFLRTRMAEQQRCRERWDCPRCSSRRRHLSGNLDSRLIPSRPFPSLASCEAWSGPRPRLPVPLVTGRPAVPRPARPLGLSRPKAGDVGSADVSQANAGMERLFHERATYQTTRLRRALGNAPIGPVPILPTACLASQRATPPRNRGRAGPEGWKRGCSGKEGASHSALCPFALRACPAADTGRESSVAQGAGAAAGTAHAGVL